MQTLVAYAWRHDVPTHVVDARLRRVEGWYADLWGKQVTVETGGNDHLGLRLWNRSDEPCRWPAWASYGQDVVATLHLPRGHQELIGPSSPEDAPRALTRWLHDRPQDVSRLTAPFVLARYDAGTESLELWTDGLGLGRLFEVRTDEGWFWSNRPVAALLLAGLRAEADPLAWRRMAACDWPMGEATPYRHVRAVSAGTNIRVDRTGRRDRSIDVLTSLVAARRDPLSEATLADTAGQLIGVARAVAQSWPGAPVLSLSGGRDSRLVVAAFLAAGVQVRLRTNGDLAGEADTARELVRRLGDRVEHEVRVPAAQRPPRLLDGAFDRARQWHDTTEGLRPALYLRRTAPRALIQQRSVLVGGAGGEFGHAPGYPADVERLDLLPPSRRLAAFAGALQAKIVLPRGVSREAEADVAAQVEKVLAHAAARGVSDAKALDWFYADERLRRWGMVGESHGVVLPLLSPAFVVAGFGLTTAQSNESRLHHGLIARLLPAWSDVPFFTATLKQRGATQHQRLWQEADVDLLSGLVADPGNWGDGFDVPRVQEIWRQSLAGRAAARDELLLQRVVWRAAFTDHLASVNRETAPARRRLALPVSSEPVRLPERLVRRLAVRANDVRWARRLARTSLGRRLRRRLGA